MGTKTAIAWCDHTFNPWIGCAKVSSGCLHCYAERDTFARRARANGHELWGPGSERHVTSDSYWEQPLRWNREAKKTGRRRVFCGSLMDVFEQRRDLDPLRHRLFDLIWATPNLDWLLLTKRPESWRVSWPNVPIRGYVSQNKGKRFANVSVGVTAENQEMADCRIPLLLEIPAAVRFLSCEPLLGPVSLGRWLNRSDVDWVIVGGESGPHARPCNLEWIRTIVRQCGEAGVPCFVKQLGAASWARGPEGILQGPCPWNGGSKGGDPAEWPEDVRVRQFPEVARR